MSQWYYAVNGQAVGPVDDASLAQLVQNGTIDWSTPVAEAGSQTWSTVSDEAGRLGLSPAAPAAAPVAPTFTPEPTPAPTPWEQPTAAPAPAPSPWEQPAAPATSPTPPATPSPWDQPAPAAWSQPPAASWPPPGGAAPGAYGTVGGYSAPGGSAGVGGPPADLGKRVVAYIIDAGIPFVLIIAAFIVGAILSNIASGLGGLVILLGYLGAIGFSIWNVIIRQGQTGQSIGKEKQGIKLVRIADGAPLGAGGTFVRYLLGSVLGSLCWLDYWWVFTNPNRQRLSDNILKSNVFPS